MNGARREWINRDDVEELKNKLKIGSIIEQEYQTEKVLDNGTVERRTKRRKRRIIRKFPHLVEVESEGTRRETVTYHEILVRAAQRMQQEMKKEEACQ